MGAGLRVSREPPRRCAAPAAQGTPWRTGIRRLPTQRLALTSPPLAMEALGLVSAFAGLQAAHWSRGRACWWWESRVGPVSARPGEQFTTRCVRASGRRVQGRLAGSGQRRRHLPSPARPLQWRWQTPARPPVCSRTRRQGGNARARARQIACCAAPCPAGHAAPGHAAAPTPCALSMQPVRHAATPAGTRYTATQVKNAGQNWGRGCAEGRGLLKSSR